MIRILIDVRHTAPQARLQLGGVVAEQVHDHAPRSGREDGPRVAADGGARGRRRHTRQPAAGLHGQAREREDDAREDVDDDLLTDAADLARPRGAAAEDDVAAD